MKIKHKVATCRNVTFQRICGLQKPKSAAFILATGLWGSCRNIAKEVTTCNHCCRLRYDTLVCTHPFLCESTPLLSWMHWNVLYHTLFLLQSDGLTTLGERRAAAFRALCTDWEWQSLRAFCKAGLKYIITTQETRENILSIHSIDGKPKSAALMTVLNAATPVLSPAVCSVWVMCCLTQEWMAKDGDVNSGC